MDVPEDFTEEDDVVPHPDRAAMLQENRQSGRKLQPQQLIGGIGFLLILGLGFGYYTLNQPSSTLKGAETGLNITPKTTSSFADLVIASKSEPKQDIAPKPATIVNAAVAPAPELIERDSDATLKRLSELTVQNAEASGLIKTLQADLERANEEARELARQINDLKAQNDSANTLGDNLIAEHNATIDQLRLQYENQLTVLRGELELARAQAPVDPNTDEQRRRLEEARKRKQAQIESEAIIFDDSQKDSSNTIRY